MRCKSDLGCDPKRSRKMRTAWPQPVEGTWAPGVHAACGHNEVRALLKRTLGPTPKPAESCRAPLAASFGKLRAVARRYDGEYWDYLATAESYGGKLRRRYLAAERSLMTDGPVSSGDICLRAFLKSEKVQFAKFAKPRMIFPRSPRYNLALASYLKPFEHWLWGNLRSVAQRGVRKSRVVAKGLNPRERANLIRRKFCGIQDCVVFEVDGKAFEAHLDVYQLAQEHNVYMTAFGGNKELRSLLNSQVRNFGVTSNGVRFARPGFRASGDYNTGMGNSLIMCALVDSAMTVIGTSRYDSLVDGDNALLFLPRSEVAEVIQRFATVVAEVSGHEMVLERPVDYLEGVRFGQSAPVETSSGWTMVRDWRKVLSGGTSSHANLNEPGFGRAYLHGVALCELSLARGVPIIGRWAESLRQATQSDVTRVLDHLRDYQVLGVDLSALGSGRGAYVEPCAVARESFARAFGVSVERQLRLESELGCPRVVVDPAAPAEWSDFEEFLEPQLQGCQHLR